jgi:hypothetical protein
MKFQELASQYPFVHHLISTTPGRCNGGVGLDPIIAFIQDLIASHHPVMTVFSRLHLLSVRYMLAQTPEPLEPWNGKLSYEFTILDDIDTASPWKIAESWTDRHKELFVSLRNDEYLKSDWLGEINETWNRLSRHVQECALAGGSLVEKLAQIETARK